MLEQLFSAMGAGFCVALLMVIAKDYVKSRAALCFMALIFAAMSFLLHDWLPAWLRSYNYLIQSASPAFFWFSCRLIFLDGVRFPLWGLIIAVYSFTAPVGKIILELTGYGAESWVHLLGREVPQYCEYALIILGLSDLWSNWQDDLVESRRKLRWAIMGAAGLSLGWAVFSFNLGWGNHASRILAIDLSLLIIMWFLFRSRTEIWQPIRLLHQPVAAQVVQDSAGPAEPSAGPDPESEEEPMKLSEELIQINQAMELGFYRRENLTLKDLALEVSLPEYKVRAVINKELGYRNFNEYINEYRINEAASRLAQEPETPISNIALDVGYRTLSSFNRAFKKHKETTPTAFREEFGA